MPAITRITRSLRLPVKVAGPPWGSCLEGNADRRMPLGFGLET